jgi:hypothetical protein
MNARMKHFVSYLLCAVSTYGLCRGDMTKSATANSSNRGLSVEERKALENVTRFHEVHSTGDLPGPIIAVCAGDKKNLAEPGGKWNATDSIIDPSLPGKRLIWAAIGGDYYVVHYERGGIAHTFHVLVARFAKSDTNAKEVWNAMGGPFKDYPAFIAALRTGKLNDRLDWR